MACYIEYYCSAIFASFHNFSEPSVVKSVRKKISPVQSYFNVSDN